MHVNVSLLVAEGLPRLRPVAGPDHDSGSLPQLNVQDSASSMKLAQGRKQLAGD
ncbi:hypothetical protein [Pseudomonas sp. CDFA 610]|uniref:hypothetical protein n=1 Tax=Pseudomonas sp. CDFA 610 TaxID=2829825 RepID=UPI001E56AF19|nr:hypothetical protein [Pseudomonas sp. CDFA 610]MCD5981988.1 hypothetical protein [Pseudomonas sp. CDFA 610]